MANLKVGDIVYTRGVITEVNENDTYTIEQMILAPYGGTHEAGLISSMVPISEVVAQSAIAGSGKRSK